MDQRLKSGQELGRAFVLFAVAFAVFVLVVALAAQLGLADSVVVFSVVLVTLMTYAVIGFVTRSLSLSDFLVAGRRIPAGLNGMATAAALLSASGLVGLVGAFLSDGGKAVAIVAGWVGGLALLAVLVAPYYRKSGAVSVPDFLAVRFGNPMVRILATLILLALTAPLLVVAMSIAATIAGAFFGIDHRTAVIGAVIVLLLSSLLGGMRTATLVAAAQAIVMLLGFVAPAVLASIEAYGFPLAPITAGYALEDLGNSAEPFVTALPSALLPLAGLDWFNLFALALTFAAAAASMPHVVARSGVARSMSGARRSIAWALLVVALVVMTAPAIAAFTEIALFDSIAGVDLAELPGWLFSHGAQGWFQLCDADATSLEALEIACAGADSPTATVAVDPDWVALAFADASGLPYVMTALIAAGGLAAALAGANAALITLAASLTHDIYATFLARGPTAGRRLIVGRFLLIAIAVGGGYAVLTYETEAFAWVILAPAVAAAGLFPVIVLGIWWRRATFWGALAGMLTGAGTVAAYAYVIRFGGVTPQSIVGLTDQGIDITASAVLAMPAAFVATIVVSYLTPAPSDARLAVIDAIRRPSRDPVLEDHAV